MEEQEQFENITIEELAEGILNESIVNLDNEQASSLPELPENSPRYVVLSYELKHRDGRTSFPLVLVNWAPSSSEMKLMTLHASAFLDFQNVVRTVFRY